MSEEKVTYMELKLPSSKKKNNKRRPTNKNRGVPWHIVALNLGILCFLLLLTTSGLGYMYLLNSPSCATGEDPKANFTNSLEVENQEVLPTPTGKQNPPGMCVGKWSCCGKDCYYYSKEEKTWDESKKSCQNLGSTLIKIDDEMKQSFIESRIDYNYWIGLQRKGDNVPWMWLDGSSYSQKLNFHLTKVSGMSCGYIKVSRLENAACTRKFPFICEKKSNSRATVN